VSDRVTRSSRSSDSQMKLLKPKQRASPR
jgi:hypothetical protein